MIRIHDDSAQFKFDSCVILWTNHNSLLSIATNRVCQSGEIWNKRLFPYILIINYITQIDSMLPCVCSVIDRRWRQNVVRTKSGTRGAAEYVTFCSYHILTSSAIYYWTDTRQHGIYLFYIINNWNIRKKPFYFKFRHFDRHDWNMEFIW